MDLHHLWTTLLETIWKISRLVQPPQRQVDPKRWEFQDNSISQHVVRQARQILPKKAEAHVAMEIIGCEKQAPTLGMDGAVVTRLPTQANALPMQP